MKKLVWVFAAIAAAALAYFTFAPGGEPDGKGKAKVALKRERTRGSKNPRDAVRGAMGARKTAARPKGSGDAKPDLDMFKNLTGEDRKRAQAVQDAIDANDFERTLAAAEKALASPNAEVRAGAVEALAWFGADALPELTAAMGDRDEEVAAAAGNAWEIALTQIESGMQRFDIAAAALATVSRPDTLDGIGAQLVNSALEIIDGEDDAAKASDARVKVLQALVDIIEDGKLPRNAKAAKEAYESITGAPYLGIDEAELYLGDPDNYEPPENRQ
ncbi:MAG: HEAT repeat domain-containing protein [Kiritimatiellae bacterium]|nr:HEAT repeat domain-containing protein [Kiritimatiellia bacterium]